MTRASREMFDVLAAAGITRGQFYRALIAVGALGTIVAIALLTAQT